ncbi:LOW QUALITY PROTEIN: hypothetical protein HID58_014419 [Brassica napus]|uniref:Uncharacterized protein n=1 Tax=Brassica napus TaxID=3708 RepID=A0ABQ8DH36_BRANA|nr:LOW QUALITY PROTEIN: hypothetical protein HID58_014419 [Brassica napus]
MKIKSSIRIVLENQAAVVSYLISFHILYGRTISRLVHRCSQNFRLSDSLLTIWFSDSNNVHNLSDVISELTAVRSTKLEGFWGDSRVVVANSIKPKMVEGVFLSGIKTHAYYHAGFQRPRNTHVPSFLRGYAKVEPLTIAELNEFVIISEPQVVQSVFTVHEEAPPNGLILYLRELKYLGLLRYHVEMSIADDTVEGCLCWIRLVMTKLHNVRAYEAGNLIVGTSLSGIAIKKPQASKSLKVMKKLRVVMQMEYLLFQK